MYVYLSPYYNAVTPARFNLVRYLTICLHFKNKLKETLLPSGSLFGVFYILVYYSILNLTYFTTPLLSFSILSTL